MLNGVRKTTIFAALLGVACATALSQRPGPNNRKAAQDERMEVLRIAFISEALELTPEESQSFWPVHNEFQEAMEKVRERMQGVIEMEGSSEVVEQMRSLRHEEVNLGAEWIHTSADIIGYERAVRLQRIEREFRKVLLSRMNRGGSDRPGGSPGGGEQGRGQQGRGQGPGSH